MLYRNVFIVAILAALVLAAAPSFSQDKPAEAPSADGTTRPPKDPSQRPPRPHGPPPGMAGKDGGDVEGAKEGAKGGSRGGPRNGASEGDRKMGAAPDGTRPPPHRRAARPDGDTQAQRRDDGSAPRQGRPPAPPNTDGKTTD